MRTQLAAALKDATDNAIKKIAYHLKRNAKAMHYHWKSTVDGLKLWAVWIPK